ncbi:unnamed protein product [Kuraishia capsulata CBS 1993]|uniref:P/Homo B domain-containing protein n=1 Tax=Kuraishia capsulata CBS 1993 TaxID=1382522 RepID=W6MHX9_9ASCO|nr:uncharacterized protein KUCA_T00001940001 [Kuraishia capsulata CBS 1993]CDK25969.1 unnamed protein product [Kuraishia capsulata CBS 1993]
MHFRTLYRLACWLALCHVSACTQVTTKDFDSREYFAVQLEESIELEAFKDSHNDWQYEHAARGLEHYHVFSTPIDKLRKRGLEESLDIKSFHPLPPKRLVKRMPVKIDSSMEPLIEAEKRLKIDDPLFAKQWHLVNTASPGDDVNVTGLWYEGITGKGVVTAIVDDGLDMDSKDLKRSFCKEGSWDFNDNTNLPKPRLDDDYHGTRCAAEIAAEKGNDYCGIGVAYDSKVAGLRILSGQITAEDEAAAMIYAPDVNDIYSCSWGPPDDGKSMQEPEKIVKEAMLKGVLDGRKGKGSLYIFASGNGGMHNDNCNFDGYTNSIYSITVSAIDHKGLHPPYAEACSAVMTVTYSSGSGEHIHTSDINDKCTDIHGGTSAAAPLAAGLYALVLQGNPDLTWRDVQYLTLLTSVEVNENDGSWHDGPLGRRYSHKYGYGKLDAYNMVQMAKTWKSLKPQSWFWSPVQRPGSKIESQKSTLTHEFTIDKEWLEKSNFDHVEHVVVTVNIGSSARGKTAITLKSPGGIVSELAVSRRFDHSTEGWNNWSFSSVAHWGESGEGTWTLEVSTTDAECSVDFNEWQLKLFGESIDETKVKRFSLDSDYSFDPNAQESEESSTIVTSSTSTSVSTTAAKTTSETSAVSTSDAGDATNEGKGSEATGGEEDEDDGIDGEDGSYRHSTEGHYSEYFFFLVIIGFVIFLALFKSEQLRRKRRRRGRTDEYEFDVIQPDDDFDTEEELTDDSSLVSRDHADNPFATTRKSTDLSKARGIPASKLPRNSVDQKRAQQLAQDSRREDAFLRTEEEERQKLFDNMHGFDGDDDEDEMFRIGSSR